MSNDDSWPPALPLDLYPPPPGSKQPDGHRTGLRKVAAEGTFGAVLGGLSGLFFPNMDLTRPDHGAPVAEAMPGSRGVAGSFMKFGGAIKRGGKNALFLGGFFALSAALEETGNFLFPQYVRHTPAIDYVRPHPVVVGVSSGLAIAVTSVVFKQNPLGRAVLFSASITSASYLCEWIAVWATGQHPSPPPTSVDVWKDERRDQLQFEEEDEEEGEEE